MRKIASILLGIILGLTILVSRVEAAEKFASVNMERIASGYLKAKEYMKSLGDKETAYTTEIDRKRDETRQFQDKFNLLSDKEKETKKAELESKIKDLQELVRQKQADFRKETFDKTMEISKDIKGAISNYAKKESYTLVFDAATLAYQPDGIDITDKILGELNKGYKK